MLLPDTRPPRVLTLDARAHGLDPHGLRAWARSTTRRSGARFTSRSYRYPHALVAIHTGRVGVDLERIQTCDTAFADLICTPTERRDPACVTDPDHYLTSLWCSKEALAKALGDARRYEPSRIDSPLTWSQDTASPWQTTELTVAPGFVAWLCWEHTDTPAASPRPDCAVSLGWIGPYV